MIPDQTAIHWFAIQTQAGSEDVARCQIAALDLETLLPKARRIRVGSDRPSPLKSLFPGYLFARFCPGLSLRAVRYARGVSRVLSAGPNPVPVEPAIIDEIRSRMDADGWVPLEQRPWQPGDALEVIDGPFRGCRGIFERELDDRRRVVLLLEAIHQARVIVEKGRIELAGR
jgi:transcriptional antiterminator RfaH